MEKDLDEKFGEDSVLSKIVPWLSRWIDTKTHTKQYERAVRTFLDLRKKNPKQARQNLVKAAQINNVDTRSLDKFFRAMVDKGVMPAHLINYHPTFMTKAFGENMELEEKKSKKFKDIRKDDPCWDGYKQVGMKKKNGKEVPNCVPEETEITEMKLPISDEMFKSLKKGDKIKINFDSSIKKGNENTYVVQSKSKSAKYNLEKIKLKNASNPVAQASYLYNRQGKVTMSQGDMAVTMNSVVKEAVSALGDYKANLTPDSSKPLGGKIERPHLVKSYKNRKHASRWVRVVYDFDAAVKKYPRKAVRELGKKDQWGEKIVQIWENENMELEAANLLNEGMSPSQIAQLKKAYGSIDKVDVTGPAYKKAKAFIANMSKDELMTMAKAKVKWLSQFAASELAKTHNVRLKAKDYMESLSFSDFRKNLEELSEESVDEASKEGTVRIIDLGNKGQDKIRKELGVDKLPNKGFQVQVMTKGKFVNQGKPYKTMKDAEKVRSTGQHSMQFDEAALKTSDYPKGTSMSAKKFKDSQKKMSKQRALTTKDYPKGTSMSATAWKNRQEEVELDEGSREADIKKTISIMKKYPANKGKSEKELRKGAIAYLDQYKKEEVDTGQYAARKKPTSSKQSQQSVFDKHRERMQKLRNAPKGAPMMKKAGKDAKMLRFVLNRDVKLRKESIELDEKTKWKMGDGRPRNAPRIENERFWNLPYDSLKYIAKDAGDAMRANPTARKATTGPGNWADQVADAATVMQWRKKNGIKESVELEEKDVKVPLELLKLYNKGMALLPGSIEHKKVMKQIDDMQKKLGMKESVELDEAKVPDGMKFAGGYNYKGTKHVYYTKGNKATSPVVVYIDDKMWKEFPSLRKAQDAALAHIKSMKESIELDEAIDFRKAFMDIQSYAKKNGGMDKTDFEKVAYYVKAIGDNQNTPNVANKAFMLMKKHIAGLDTDVRDGIHMLLKKHGMIKNGRIVQESIELDEAKCGCCGNEITAEGCGCGSDCEHCGGMGKVLGESLYKVEIEGLPATFVAGTGPSDVRQVLRKLLKKPDYVQMVKRVPDSEMKSYFRMKASGKEMQEALSPSMKKIQSLIGNTDTLSSAIDIVSDKMTKGNRPAAEKLVKKFLSDVMKEALDPVGKADADIDNDGDVDKSDKYLHNRRKSIKKAINKVKKKDSKKIGSKNEKIEINPKVDL